MTLPWMLEAFDLNKTLRSQSLTINLTLLSLPLNQISKNPSWNVLFNISRDEDTATVLVSLFQCFTTISVKKIFLISDLKHPLVPLDVTSSNHIPCHLWLATNWIYLHSPPWLGQPVSFQPRKQYTCPSHEQTASPGEFRPCQSFINTK